MAGKSNNGRVERARALCDRSRNERQKAVLLGELARIRNAQGADLVAHAIDLHHASTGLRQPKSRRP
jgi:hypothetical protein